MCVCVCAEGVLEFHQKSTVSFFRFSAHPWNHDNCSVVAPTLMTGLRITIFISIDLTQQMQKKESYIYDDGVPEANEWSLGGDGWSSSRGRRLGCLMLSHDSYKSK